MLIDKYTYISKYWKYWLTKIFEKLHRKFYSKISFYKQFYYWQLYNLLLTILLSNVSRKCVSKKYFLQKKKKSTNYSSYLNLIKYKVTIQ